MGVVGGDDPSSKGTAAACGDLRDRNIPGSFRVSTCITTIGGCFLLLQTNRQLPSEINETVDRGCWATNFGLNEGMKEDESEVVLTEQLSFDGLRIWFFLLLGWRFVAFGEVMSDRLLNREKSGLREDIGDATRA
mmetsp:Transcript_25684/g.53496  ORF Transcript_25684/g.53496 Transcript_25684/m.53496 type:complete len:135 (-) Transcript_25684:71-475(-)